MRTATCVNTYRFLINHLIRRRPWRMRQNRVIFGKCNGRGKRVFNLIGNAFMRVLSNAQRIRVSDGHLLARTQYSGNSTSDGMPFRLDRRKFSLALWRTARESAPCCRWNPATDGYEYDYHMSNMDTIAWQWRLCASCHLLHFCTGLKCDELI